VPEPAWLLRFTDADALVFFDNAKRLRKDGNRCRSPARLGLLELSLEQATIGLLIIFREIIDESPKRGEIISGTFKIDARGDDAGDAAILEAFLPHLNDETILRASRGHAMSLRELVSLLALIDNTSKKFLGPGRVLQPNPNTVAVRHRFLYRLVRFSRLGPKVLALSSSAIESLRKVGIERLDKELKNASFYARINPATSRASLPRPSPEVTDQVRRATAMVEHFGRGLLIGRETRRRVSKRRRPIA